MARNTGNNHRIGSVRERSQISHPSNPAHSIKRDTDTGQFMSGKEGPYKGVTQEKDGRKP